MDTIKSSKVGYQFHSLNVDLKCVLKKQKVRKTTKGHVEFAKQEVKRLFEVGVIREV